MKGLHKQAEISQTATAVGALALPLVADSILSAAMGPGAYTKVKDPHFPLKKETLMYTPVAEATERVRQGKGSMLDHMQAYRHPLQPQANPAYAIGNKLGPGILSRVSKASDFLWGQGYGQSGAAGAATGTVAGLLLNAVLRAQGKSEMPYWQSALLGAGIGGAAGLGGSHHRQYYQNKFPKYAPESNPTLPVQAPIGAPSTDTPRYLPGSGAEFSSPQQTSTQAAQPKFLGIPAGDLIEKLRSLRDKFQPPPPSQLQKASAWRSPEMNTQAAQASVRSLMSMLQAAPGLSFNQRAQLMSGVSSLDANSARELQRLVSMSGGAAIGVIVARFLMGKGLGATVLGAMLGGVMGNALFGNSQPRTSTGRPSMSGIDFSGRRF
jgi:hypothetical protein